MCDLCLLRDQHRPVNEAGSHEASQMLVNNSLPRGLEMQWVPDQVAGASFARFSLLFLRTNQRISRRLNYRDKCILPMIL